MSGYVADFNTRNHILTAKLFKQGFRYQKLRKTFSKFYRRHFDLVSTFKTGLISVLKQGLSEPEFYGDLGYSYYRVYISQLIRIARVSGHVADFNTGNQILTAKLFKQGYRYHKLRETFSKFYRRHFDLVSKFKTGLISVLKQGLSEPEFYSDLGYTY